MIEHIKASLTQFGWFSVKEVKEGILITPEICKCCRPYFTARLAKIDNENYFPMFHFQFSPFIEEDMTDSNEIVSSIIIGYLKLIEQSSFRFLGEVDDFAGLEDELCSVYWFPSQPLGENLRIKSEKDVEVFISLMRSIWFSLSVMNQILDIDNSKGKRKTNTEELVSWTSKIISCLGSEDITYINYHRVNPDWLYFRSRDSNLSVVQAPQICSNLKYTFNRKKADIVTIEGVTSVIERYDTLQHAIKFSDVELAKDLLKGLGDDSSIVMIPQENQILFISDYHIIILYSLSGIYAVSKEKELIYLRQQREIELLFGDKKFEWHINTRKESAEFEDLVLELLNREPWVISVKKVAPTNQGDNGRDLICDYDKQYFNQYSSKSNEKRTIGRMIIQCKTNLKKSKKQSIGKSDVDIADTIYEYQCDGYMVIVNTQITRDLTEYLEKIALRHNQDRVDWWNSFEIEDRLRKNQDILARYNHLVKYANE